MNCKYIPNCLSLQSCFHVITLTKTNIYIYIKYTLRYLGIEDYNATAVYMQSISPITSGIDGRINVKYNNSNEKSAGLSINTWNYRLLVTILIITVLFFNV